MLVSVAKLLIWVYDASLDIETPVLKNATEELSASNRKYDEEEQHDEDCVLKHRNGRKHSDDQNLEPLNT